MPHDESSGNELRLGKRGVYAISGDGKLKTFRLIGWEQILKTLEAKSPQLKTKMVRSRRAPKL